MYRVLKFVFKLYMIIIWLYYGILYCVDFKKFFCDCYYCKFFVFVYFLINKNLVISWI